MKNPIHTFQTRLVIDEQTNSVLEKTAKLLSKVERCLFADIMSGKKISDLKSAYLNRFQITARQFNACRVNVEGLIDSRKKLQAQYIDELKQKIKSLEKGVKTKCAQKRFLKKRRLNKLKERLKRLETDKENGTVHICFGTKKLFRAQFHLEESNFQSIEEWKESWEEARSKAFFCLGSKDETSGNQTCRATIQDDGNITLRIRLPNILVSTYGPYITITDLHFKYGHNEIITSLRDCQYRNELQKLKKPLYKEHGQAISYRFLKDAKGWRLFVSTALFEPEWKTSSRSGLIGLDINTDHLAIVETDRYGNPISKRSIPLHLYGKDKKQSLAEIGPACAEAINIAKEEKKDLIIEELDFKRKKAELKEGSKYRRMLRANARRI